MSDEVYGFADFPDCGSPELSANEAAASVGVGIIPISQEELFNFTDKCRPSENAAIFMVTDGPGIETVSYLVDLVDYAPDANIGLPSNGKERLGLLIQMIENLFSSHGAIRVCLAITDSSEIDETHVIDSSTLRNVIMNDCLKFAPPCCLYDIRTCTD